MQITRNFAAATGIAIAQFVIPMAAVAEGSHPLPGIPVNPEREAYYGDLHLHTSYSLDAYLMGTTNVGPNEAYRFAKGEVVQYLGRSAQRREPLDFLALTDHAENIGVQSQLADPNSVVSQSEWGNALKKLMTAPPDTELSSAAKNIQDLWKVIRESWVGSDHNALPESLRPESVSAWQREVDYANRHYEPGKFTTFIGYEWTSTPYGDNLHRNVIFAGNSAPYPFTSLDSKKPEDLWAWLQSIRKKGYEALAIPHNGNASNGLMYDWVDSRGFPIDLQYAEARQANEPLTEIAQIKGSSETHPLLSPNDEFANYEILDRVLWVPREQSRPSGSYVRDALSRGLILQRELGVNPYKYGFVGGSDLHSGLSVSAQADFVGGDVGVNLGGGQLSRDQAAHTLKAEQSRSSGDAKDYDSSVAQDYDLKMSPGNLTGVWAESNTRESIFRALRRRETFATSGTKLKFRFFASWDFEKVLLRQKHWVAAAYATGVPMGSDLPPKPPGPSAPTFVVWAVKDPNSGNLDRAQIIKVWEDNGQQKERVFDVAWSGDRKPDITTGLVPAVSNTVDLRTGKYSNSVGVVEIKCVWKDPEFNPHRFAAYYLRVLEIHTPRWSTLLAIQNGLPLPEDAPATVQERGWSSPIWYVPASK